MSRGRSRRVTLAGSLLAILATLAPPVHGQSPRVHFQDTSGTTSTVLASAPRGYAAVPFGLLAELGWAVETTGTEGVARLPGGGELRVEDGSPFVLWDGDIVQLADAPFVEDDVLQVPVQLITDFLPAYLPFRFAFDPDEDRLRMLGEEEGRLARAAAASAVPRSEPAALPPVEPVDEVRVVVIDPGHGGNDTGTRGAGGTREKNVVLAIGRTLAELLSGDPDLEVHLLRDRDVFVPVWERGEQATELRGSRPGVFVSLHVNASPGSRAVRGFETYFLAEARTEHARRIAAVENASAPAAGEDPLSDVDPDLDFILKELRTFDHEHWSALLAEMVQSELDPVHPGPNRGVKQAPLAVLTNALMPSVLVELGYVTNRQEERLLNDPEFQRGAAQALADAILRFFERYPTGQDPSGGSR